MIHSTNVHGQTSLREKKYLEGWQRTIAEMDNYRKRINKHQDQARQQEKQSLILPLLNLADNFNSMTKHIPPELSKHSWTKGVVQISRLLEQILEDMGVTSIDSDKKKFDPSLHEAIAHTDSKAVKSGFIKETIQKGYLMNGSVIRPARVKVAK
jgi:molecular chaperone GrpE